MSCSSCNMYKQSSSSGQNTSTNYTTCAFIGGSISAAITLLVVYVLMSFIMKKTSTARKFMYSVIISLVVGAVAGYVIYIGDAPQMIYNLCFCAIFV